MKNRSNHYFSSGRLAVVSLSSCFMLQMACAGSLYWDIDGATANTGTTAAGAWDGIATNWNTDSTGDAGGSVTAATSLTDDLFFSSGTNFTGAFAVTIAAGTQNGNSLTYEEGTVTVSGGTTALGVTPGVLALGTSSTVNVASGVTGLLNASLTGTTGLTKTGAGNLLLGTSNIYNSGLTGVIGIKEGALSAGSSASNQNATNAQLISLGDTTGTATATFSVNRNQNFNSNIQVNSGSSGVKRISGGPGLTAQQAPSITGTVALNDDLTLGNGTSPVYTGNNYGGVRLSGVITGNKKITVNGANAFTTPQDYTTNFTSATLATTMAQLSGANTSSFTGNVSVERGALVIQNSGAIGNGTALVTTAPGAVVNLANQSISIAGLGNGSSTGGSVANLGASLAGTAGTSTLTLKGSGSYSYGGVIQDGTFSGSNAWKVALTLNMAGGTQTLTGANTYSGNTSISAGTLSLSSTGSLKFYVKPAAIPADTNKISGSGTASLDGTIFIDLTNAGSPTVGDSWSLIGSSGKSYGSNFNVDGFIETSSGSGVWQKDAGGGNSWTFIETTGQLNFGSSRVALTTWDGGGVDANWSSNLNWDQTPLTGDTLIFGGSVQTTTNNDLDTTYVPAVVDPPTPADPATFFVGGIQFASGAAPFTLQGNPIDFAGKTITNNSSNTQTIDCQIQIDEDIGDLSVNASSGDVVLNNLQLRNGFNKALNKSGAQTLFINGPLGSLDTFHPYVNQGTMVASSNGNLFFSADIAAGATLRTGGTSTSGVLHNGGTVICNGILNVAESVFEDIGNLTGSGIITNQGGAATTSTIALRGSASNTFSGTIQNGASGGVTALQIGLAGIGSPATAAGTVTLSGANTYTGDTTMGQDQLDSSLVSLVLSSTGSLSFKPGANGVCNKITSVQPQSTGTVTLDGTFNIDLAGAAIANGNQWLLVDVDNLNEDFNTGGTFSIAGFAADTPVANQWRKVDGDKTWTFDETTGILSLAYSGSVSGYSTWATANGIPGQPADGDYDNDGLSNLEEYALGKSPTLSSQPAGILSGYTITYTKGGDAITNGDVSWVIESSTTLAEGSWTNEVAQAAGDPSATIAYTFTPGTPAKKFARLKVVLTTP